LVGTAVAEALLNDDRFIRADSAGEAAATSALQEARLSRIYGYDIFVSPMIDHGAAYMFHRTAFIMATRTPALPMGAIQAGALASAPGQNIALRWLVDYDPTITSNRSLIDCYVGYKVVEDPNGVGFVRARKIQLVPEAAAVGGVSVSTVSGDATITAAAGPDHTVQLRVIDQFGDDVTAVSTFASSVPADATVSAGGLVTGVSDGSTTITATYNGDGVNDHEDEIVITVV
jgi:hypothetical protein